MSSGFRKERVREMLQGFISDLFLRMRDPRLSGIQVSAVEVTGDLRHANVFWSFLVLDGVEAEKLKPEVEQALQGLKGFIRKRIAEELDLRYVPDIHFDYDNSAVTGAYMDRLLDKVAKS